MERIGNIALDMGTWDVVQATYMPMDHNIEAFFIHISHAHCMRTKADTFPPSQLVRNILDW